MAALALRLHTLADTPARRVGPVCQASLTRLLISPHSPVTRLPAGWGWLPSRAEIALGFFSEAPPTWPPRGETEGGGCEASHAPLPPTVFPVMRRRTVFGAASKEGPENRSRLKALDRPEVRLPLWQMHILSPGWGNTSHCAFSLGFLTGIERFCAVYALFLG